MTMMSKLEIVDGPKVAEGKRHGLELVKGDVIAAAQAYQEAAGLPVAARTSVIAAASAHFGLQRLIAYQKKLTPDRRKAMVMTSRGYVITETKLKEIDDFVRMNIFPYNALYVTKDGQVAIRANGWRLKGQADPRIFKGFEEQPITSKDMGNGHSMFTKQVTALFWSGDRYPGMGAADTEEVGRRIPGVTLSIVAMIAETRARTRALRDAIGLPFEVAEDVMSGQETAMVVVEVKPVGVITSISELVARAMQELGLRKADILRILDVPSLDKIEDLNAAWETLKAVR